MTSRRPGVALYRHVAEDLVAQVDRSELMPGERLAPRPSWLSATA